MLKPSDGVAFAEWRLAALLALVAGYVDCFALINLGVFSSFMSGNTTQGGMYTGEGEFLLAGKNLLPIPCFVLGVMAGAMLFGGASPQTIRWRCWFVASLLALSGGIHYLGPLALWGNIITLSFAMGVMNTTIEHVGRQSVSLGYVSGDLNNLGRHLALAIRGLPVHDAQGSWDTAWSRTGILASVWSFFLIGAVLSAAGMHFSGKWILLPAIVLLCVLAYGDQGLHANRMKQRPGSKE